MFVKQFSKQKLELDFSDHLNYQVLNSVKIDEMRRNDLLIDCKRKITVFDHSSILDQIETEEDYILLENRVVHRNTPRAYDIYFDAIEKSYMYSMFLFVKPRSKQYEQNGALTLLYGFSTGYGEFKKPRRNIYNIKYLDYGFSILDQINNFNSRNENLTYQFHKYKLFDNNCAFFGPIIPNIYTESQWEYLFKEKYNQRFTRLDRDYYLKDLCDDNTEVEKTRFRPINKNDFEVDSDMFTMNNFEKICFLFIFYHINSINVIYHTKRGINFDNVVKEFSFDMNRNQDEFKELMKSLLDRIHKTELFHKASSLGKENDFLIMISATPYAYSLHLICENNGKEIVLKITKAEMMEKIFSNFTLNSNLLATVINEKNRKTAEQQRLLGYYSEDEYEKHNNYSLKYREAESLVN